MRSKPYFGCVLLLYCDGSKTKHILVFISLVDDYDYKDADASWTACRGVKYLRPTLHLAAEFVGTDNQHFCKELNAKAVARILRKMLSVTGEVRSQTHTHTVYTSLSLTCSSGNNRSSRKTSNRKACYHRPDWQGKYAHAYLSYVFFKNSELFNQRI